MAAKKIILLTGNVQTGKTTTLTKWVQNRADVAGILTPVVNGKRQFCEIPGTNSYAMEAAPAELPVLEVGRFRFSERHFNTAVNYLLANLQQPQWNFLIADEIGPLEIKQQKGFWPVVSAILTNEYALTPLLVVRHKLIDEVTSLFLQQGFTTQIVGISYFAKESNFL